MDVSQRDRRQEAHHATSSLPELRAARRALRRRSAGLPGRVVAKYPALPNTLYAGTPFGGVFKSTDGGSHWGAVNTVLTSSYVRGAQGNEQKDILA